MGIVVQKFGGTSVANAEKILRAARRAIQRKLAGHQVAVIVSARGDTTDELIALANEIDPNPPARELDMLMATGEQQSIALLAMAIHSLGHEATSLTGGQMGILTDSIHGKARIRAIDTTRLWSVFNQGHIAIIAGFQGTDQQANITTLGRGGSDTTAVAIAAALEANLCEIYTDVDGVFTTDPRIVPEARQMAQISYDEMLELASVGAGVMHSRSIEFAKKFGVVIEVRNSASDAPGTLIRPEIPEMEHVVVRGAALVRKEARLTLRGVPDQPGVMYRIFDRLAQEHIVVDMIVQNVGIAGKTEVSFTVNETDLPAALELVQQAATEIGAEGVDYSSDVSKVSVVGLGMRTHTGVAERMFKVLADRQINILMITTSEIKISVLVHRETCIDALRAVHQEFNLDQPLPEYKADVEFPVKSASLLQTGPSEDRLRAIARSLPLMEDILVSDLEADNRQGRISIQGIPDRPGIAYQIFSKIARANIAVDMIVQNVGSDQLTNLSYTCLRSDLQAAFEATRAALADIGGNVLMEPRMSKIAVRGVGMRTHSGVGNKMFATLAEQQVNLQLINTSELHITIIVDPNDEAKSLQALRLAFGVETN